MFKNIMFFAAVSSCAMLFGAIPEEPVFLPKEKISQETSVLQLRLNQVKGRILRLEKSLRTYRNVVAIQEDLEKQVRAGNLYPASKIGKPPSELPMTIFQEPFSDKFSVPESRRRFCRIVGTGDGKTALEVSAPNMAIHLDNSLICGRRIRLTVEARVLEMSEPEKAGGGGKFLFLSKTPGRAFWHGTAFRKTDGWRKFSFECEIGFDSQEGLVVLGMQDVSGKILFRNLSVEIVNSPAAPRTGCPQ